MAEQIHGHEVMRMMVEAGKVFTKATLRSAIAERFGPDARFYTCSAQNMSSDELVAFLEARDKFVQEDEGFRTEAERICQH